MPCSDAVASPSLPVPVLGDSAAWSASLRLTVDIIFNTPLPMALLWDTDQFLVYNQAYAQLIGLPELAAPGGHAPAALPAPWASEPAALERARGGHSVSCRACNLPLWRDHTVAHKALDVYYTPVRDDGGAVRGVLCSIAPAEAVPAIASTGVLRLLVVEDNADARYLVCETLRALGHEVEAAASGEDALSLLSGQSFDVLFTDVSLPGMSGVELARQARQAHPALELLFASGYGDELTRHLEFPAQSLQKPYDIDLLQAALDRITARLQHRPM